MHVRVCEGGESKYEGARMEVLRNAFTYNHYTRK